MSLIDTRKISRGSANNAREAKAWAIGGDPSISHPGTPLQ
jgi:hypothetical protein